MHAMANLHAICTRRVDDLDKVAVGLGKDEEEKLRVCVSLEGMQIHDELAPDEARWVSMSPECAAKLYQQLVRVRHLFLVDDGPLFEPEAPTAVERKA